MPAAGYAYAKIKVEEERYCLLPAQLIVCPINDIFKSHIGEYS
ncbi:MAG: hypothetical protein RM022_004945 [Nostoc sp. EfeVER01]|nr:hypothetical protein [Nostoc sp. EfeVER01]MDZ7947837.1 hypothetical protein [Nostoc sp. EfeVER01]